MKGQMVHCPESDSILFVSSPFLNGLEGLTGRGLFISDIPLHDATRDVILVGEQARAQVTKFIAGHKSSIHGTRRKNVDQRNLVLLMVNTIIILL